MPKFTPLLVAAVLGGIAGAALIWVFAISSPPTNITIKVGEPKSIHASPGEAGSSETPGGRGDVPPKALVQASGPPSSIIEAPPVAATPHVEASAAEVSHPAGSPPAGQVRPAVHAPIVPATLRYTGPNPSPAATAGEIDESLSYALEAAAPYVKEGFTVREEYWAGDLPVKTSKPIAHQLFKENEYWFWLGTDSADARISVHLYDHNGKLTEAETWQKSHQAAARLVAKRSGTYYLIVEVEKSPEEMTNWALAYGFR
jgi:hypothetical protein